MDMLPPGCRPEAVFYTHSHGDHYNVEAALEIGVRRVYCHESWAEDASREFAAAAGKAGRPAPVVKGMAFGESIVEGGVSFMSLPANHCTSRKGEHCSMYLLEKAETRLLYATDTGGLPGEAARLAGIDAHVRPGCPITALIMEATMGVGLPDDYRLFVHSSVETVHQTVRVLSKTGRYLPPPGRKVYLTHMARTLHGSQKEIEASAPSPLAPAYDGLEVRF
jgi:phosphoribosyl 1,2-cyclic phosphodiesterase